MLDILFIILFFSFPFIIFKYMDAIGHNMFVIDISTFVIIAMFIYAYSGLLPLYFGWDEYRYNMGVQDRILVLQVLLYSILSIIGLVAGFTYARVILKLKKFQHFKIIRKLSQKEFFILIVLMIFSFIALFIYQKFKKLHFLWHYQVILLMLN